MAKDVHITHDSQIGIKGVDGANHVHVDINKIENVEAFRISKVQNIAPVAAHIKEVNHIDPITVDALNVSEVKNIEPLKIEKFNITNLPMVNLSLRQLPPLDMNIRKLPPISVGLYQDFHVPSDYSVSGRFLGIEFFRIRIDGCTNITPRERFRQEQERTANRSYAVAAAAGNPAIPSIRKEVSTGRYGFSSCGHRTVNMHKGAAETGNNVHVNPNYAAGNKKGGISFGVPHSNFNMSAPLNTDNEGSSVNSGE